MQTFLSEHTFQGAARALDQKRLVKQLLEGRQIMAALAGETKGWVNHPATKMWRGSEYYLLFYLYAIAEEMRERGYKWENNWNEIQRIYDYHFRDVLVNFPLWMKNDKERDRVVNTHRRSLYLKDPIYYARYEPYAESAAADVCCDRCNYYWPTHIKESV